VALVAALVCASLVVAVGRASADVTSTTITMNCVAHAPFIGDQFVTQSATISTDAPAAVQPGETFSFTTTFPASSIPSQQDGGTVSSVKNLMYKVPVPANSTFVNASLSGGFNYGSTPPTISLQGSPTTGYIRYNIPGPIPANQNYQLPAVTVTLTAGTAALSTIQPKLGGTSYTDPGFTTTAVVTSPISADVTTECFPSPPSPAWSTTTIVPVDTTPPAINLLTPAEGGQYPLGQTINAVYSCDDGNFGSGVDTCEGTVANGTPIDTSTLGSHSFTVTSTDNEGNASAPVTHTYNVVPGGNDTTPPQATITTPPNGAVYLQGTAVSADYACVDNESGVAACAGDVADGAALNTSTVGARTFTVSVVDNEGNPHAVLHSYRVVPNGVQQNFTSGDTANRMPVACDTLFHAFHESIPVTSNVAPTSSGSGAQFNWDLAIGDDYVPSFNNGSGLIYRWKKPTNAHFVSVAFTGAGNQITGPAIAIKPDGTLEMTIATVVNQSILGIGDDHFNPPPFRAVVQVDGAAGTVVQNQFDYFQLTTTLGGTSHCPAGDPTYNGRINPILTNTSVIDTTPPSIAIASPAHGVTYAPGSVVPFTFSCADSSGTPSCVGELANGAPIDTSSSGVYQLDVTSVDAAGNTARRWVTYTVGNPSVSVSGATVTEGPGATLDFTLTMSNPSTRTVSVDYVTVEGTAETPEDFAFTGGSATFTPGGPLTQVVSVPVVDDQAWRGNRDLTLELGVAVNGTVDVGSATGSILDDDPPPVSVSDAQVTEGPGAVLGFEVSLGADPNTPVTVDYQTFDDTATAPARYGAQSGSLTFNPGGPLTQHVLVDVVNDSTYNEGASLDNRQHMQLVATTPANGANATGIGTIVDDETQPVLVSIGSYTMREGDSANRPAKLVVTLNRPSTQQITVRYQTAPGTASAGSDFVGKSNTLTFKAGQTFKPVTINTKPDLNVESNESFQVKLSNASNAFIAHDTGTVTLLNDDGPSATGVEASVNDASLYEGGGTKTATLSFFVTLNKRPGTTVTLKYHTVNGNATGFDFVPKQGTITFTANQVSKPINIPIKPDGSGEVDETFTIVLDTPSAGLSITDSTGIGTILNDD
jgi:hypothetical protein